MLDDGTATGARTKDGTCFPKSISPCAHSNSLIIESRSEGDSPPSCLDPSTLSSMLQIVDEKG
ncbi:hypothetical protein TSUD_343150 [Trifolium subterraneum]|nr:hypothetical protein TSUD_343150 [Trifolium subterraneum]